MGDHPLELCLARVEAKAHAYARERGYSRPVYGFVRTLAVAVLRGWFRVRVAGLEHIPSEGAAIVTPNHKNFLDAFFVGISIRRKVRYMAKIELFRGPLAWLFPRLGAFPVRRGEADAEALETARQILAAGGFVVMFPEGTRIEQPDALGLPHHGAGQLALETAAPIIPAAITGTSHLWRGALPKLRRVQLTFLPPVRPATPEDGRDAITEPDRPPGVARRPGGVRTIEGQARSDPFGSGRIGHRRRAGRETTARGGPQAADARQGRAAEAPAPQRAPTIGVARATIVASRERTVRR